MSGVWCRRGDSNPHGSPHTPLKRTCLPVPPLRHVRKTLNCQTSMPLANGAEPYLFLFASDFAAFFDSVVFAALLALLSAGFAGTAAGFGVSLVAVGGVVSVGAGVTGAAGDSAAGPTPSP